MTKANKTEIEGIVRKVLNQEQNGYGEATFGARGAPGTPPDEETDLEPAVRKALSDVFNEVADELGSGEDDQDEEDEPGTGVGATTAGLELGSTRAAKAEGQRVAGGGVRGIIIILKRSRPLLLAAIRAAARGSRAFVKWVNGLSNFNPVKWAIKALPQYAMMELIAQLSRMRGAAAGTRASAAAAPDGAEPEEIEEVVRKVLTEAFAEQPPQQHAGF